MEKKTIGRFIAVLRKANGMTQKELGDKLYVSDKTVSRWERDECTPELSLIPAIAEIFGITTDELLRGERNNPDTPVTEDAKPSAKGDKQFKAMLYSRMKKYKNLSLISVGILIVGLLAAIVCNEVFHEAFLGFCIASLFIVASAICQFCFAANARIPLDDEEDIYTERIASVNSLVTRIAFAIVYAIITVFLFCIPLASNGTDGGLWTEDWLIRGSVISAITLSIFALIHLLFIKPELIKRKYFFVTEEKEKKIRFRRRILGKATCIGGSVLLLLIIAIIVIGEIGIMGFVKEDVYESFEEFGATMLEDHKEYIVFLRSFSSRVYYDDGNKVYTQPEIPDDHRLEHKEVTDFEGNVIFEYDYNTDLYKDISFSFHSDRLPIKVITNDAYRYAKGIFNSIMYSLLIIAAIDIAACAAVYFFIAYGKKSKKV